LFMVVIPFLQGVIMHAGPAPPTKYTCAISSYPS
jgi:hypothetical protein